MKKRYTIKGIIQAPNKQGLAPISVRYTFNKQHTFIPLQVSVPVTDFDAKSGLVKNSKPNAFDINRKIRTIESILSQVADTLAEPTRELVKELYHIKGEELRKQQEKEVTIIKNRSLAEKGLSIVNTFEFNEALSLKKEAKEIMSRANTKLDELKSEGYYERIEEEEMFKMHLNKYPEKFNKKVTNIEKKVNRQKDQIQSWVNTLMDFTDKTGCKLLFSEMNDEFYNLYAHFLATEKDYYNGTIGTAVNRLKTFLRYVHSQYGILVNQAFEAWERLDSEPPIVYLTSAELNKLYHEYRELDEVTPAKKKLIDTYVFQNLCGFRCSDLKESNWRVIKGILIGNPKKQYKLKVGKTRKPYKLPLALDMRIEEILKRYDYRMNHYSEGAYNRMLKQLLKNFFEKYEIHQKPYSYIRHKFEEAETVIKPYYEVFGSHSARRAFINRWASKFSDNEIMTMLGSSSLRELQRYKDKSADVFLDNVLAKLHTYNHSETL